MNEYISYKKQIKNYGHYDVVVLGGGPAGVCAAVEAARANKKVLLTECYASLGGMATSALVGPFMTSYDRDGEAPTVGGIYRETVNRLLEISGAVSPDETDSPSVFTSFIKDYHKHVTPFNSFKLQLVLDEIVKEANAEILFYTRFCDCITEDGKIKYAVLSALEGLISVSAEIFIDCTGNADVAYAAGVRTCKGNEKDGVPQPGTLMFEVGNVDDSKYTERPKYPVKAYKTPDKGRYTVNHYHVYNVDAANSKSMTDAHIQARRQVIDAYNVLKKETRGFENSEILQVGSVLGVRESRHIDGLYKITVSDIAEGKRFDDRIAVYGFGMDIHPRDEKSSGNFKVQVAKRYYIPFSAMLPKGCRNLIVAGKTISCESEAAGGLRCMPCAMAMGQAAGAAAAISVNECKMPDEISIRDLQHILVEHNAIID